MAATRARRSFSSRGGPGPSLVEDRDGAAKRPEATCASYLSRRGTLL
jgi:hypothetical protein